MDTINLNMYNYIHIYMCVGIRTICIANSTLMRAPGAHPDGWFRSEGQCNDPVTGLLSENQAARTSDHPSTA